MKRTYRISMKRTLSQTGVLLTVACTMTLLVGAGAFLSPIRATSGWTSPSLSRCSSGSLSRPKMGSSSVQESSQQENNNDDFGSDEELLREVKKSQLVALCEQYQLEIVGEKEDLLERLRAHSDDQAEAERRRRLERATRVESEDANDGKERYEIVSNDPQEEDDEGYFYFSLPTNETELDLEKKKKRKEATVRTQTSITAPPPPNVEPNEDGERVVTVYSTTDQNDLTGVAQAQPGQQYSENLLLSGEAQKNDPAPWDMQQTSQATSQEVEDAKEIVAELVHSLLAMTGAPAFREEFSEGLTPFGEEGHVLEPVSPEGFVGFDPSKVPTEIFTSSSKALRVNRGDVLKEVMREYELRAIGHDGMFGDDIEKGGGHYREVSKVAAFLKGYRRAEVRRVARETTTMLLDKVVSEGVEGLDETLGLMGRSSDDTNDAGDLNDSLIDYLNDAVRQQEKKVDQMVLPVIDRPLDRVKVTPLEFDRTSQVWNATTNEKGERVETLDPTDPASKQIIEEEFIKSQELGVLQERPESAPEQLLLLLCLLRDRVKAEAAFASDEKGRNLRILAYCLNAGSDAERESIIIKEMGTSLSRLESFEELVAGSIDYAESTAYQLKPSTSNPLNLNQLKGIKELTTEIGERQAWKASGV